MKTVPLENRTAEAREKVLELIGGYRRTSLVHLAAELGIADTLAEGPAASEELARSLNLDGYALATVLRALVGIGILHSGEHGRYTLTEAGHLLRGDARGSLRSAAVYFGGMSYTAYSGLGEALRTGGTAFEAVFDTDYYTHLQRHPDLAEHYHRMIALPAGAGAVIGSLYDFSGARTVVDLGGGNGSLLAEVLSIAPQAEGTVVDMPLCEPMVRTTFSERGLADRGAFEAGDFRVAVPAGADVYLLSRVLANWPASTAERILANCAAAMTEDSTLLVFEMVLPGQGAEDSFAVEGGLNALAHFGGAVRTRDEFEGLAGAAGLSVDRIREVDPSAHWSLIECSAGVDR